MLLCAAELCISEGKEKINQLCPLTFCTGKITSLLAKEEHTSGAQGFCWTSAGVSMGVESDLGG